MLILLKIKKLKKVNSQQIISTYIQLKISGIKKKFLNFKWKQLQNRGKSI